jgi:glutamate--cysteine ligase
MTLKDGVISYTANKSLSELFVDTPMETSEIEYALGMFFPDVRAKRYIEIRMADSMPREYTLAYAALIKGLFYDSTNLNKLLEMFSAFTDEDEQAMKGNLIKNGKNALIFGKNVYEICTQLIGWAEKTLGAESIYLQPLKESTQNKQKIFEAANIHPFAFLRIKN